VGSTLRLACGLAVCIGLLASAASATAAGNDVQRVRYEIGPFKVIPGQNEIGYAPITERPQVDGYITRIKPDLIYTNGKVPSVDVIHLHHGVWVNVSRPNATSDRPELFLAAGEEKTIVELPDGYGYPHRSSDRWVLNHMIHNLTPVPAEVYMTYTIDFIPASSPAAKTIRPVRPIWMDVMNGTLYPVFNVPKGAGQGGRYTFPDDARDPYGGGPKRNEWVVDRDGVLVATGGHLHPGGLHTDLWLHRPGARIRPARCGTRTTTAARRRCQRDAPRGSGSRAHLSAPRRSTSSPPARYPGTLR
jgi:hypothetical protein